MTPEDLNAQAFEDEVRRIAKELWPQAQFQGATVRFGLERDGVFVTDEVMHLLEATAWRTKEKAEKDAQKLADLEVKVRKQRPDLLVRSWWVTREEPTAVQRDVFQKLCPNAHVLALDQFRKRLFDISGYLEQRWKYPFGSVRDPATDNAHYDLKYVPLDILAEDSKLWSIREIADALTPEAAVGKSPQRFLLTGDYGAGKSSTLREVFRVLRKRYFAGKITQFPLLLNLRDHHGQDDPSEALLRHARKVGDIDGPKLVRAWRAGYAVVMLDGFDEIGTTGLALSHKKLSTIRSHATALVKTFVAETPLSSGVFLSGRRYYFDRPDEMKSALGVGPAFCHLSLNEFTEEQVAKYLTLRGWNGQREVPVWLPSRPLLLGYLAARGLLDQTSSIAADATPPAAWEQLLNLVYRREQNMAAGIEAESIRQIIERLASVARTQNTELGEFSADIISTVFSEVCGFQPDDAGMGIINRLPGLGVKNSETSTRCFIDETLAEAAAAGDVARFAAAPHKANFDHKRWQRSLNRFSLEVADLQLRTSKHGSGSIRAAIKTATEHRETGALGADLLRLLSMRGESYGGSALSVASVEVPTLEIAADSGSMAGVEFNGCVIERLEIEPEVPEDYVPIFRNCDIGALEGRATRDDLPTGKFTDDVTIGEFISEAGTTNAILDLGLPIAVRVLLTVLRKLFLQRGSGRQEAALFRGLDGGARNQVQEVIDLLKRNAFISAAHYANRTVWIPARKGGIRERALRMLNSPITSTDPVLLEAKRMR